MSSYTSKTLTVFLCFSISFSIQNLNGQTYDFKFKEKKEFIFSSLAIWSGIKTYDILRGGEYIDDFEDIDPGLLWRIDQRSLLRNSPKANRVSDFTLYSAIALPIITVLVDPKLRSEGWDIALMGLSGYLLENSVNQFFKIVAERPRPYIYQQAESIINQRISKNSLKSFFSGHASSAAYFSFFAAKVYADTHPESKIKPLVWGTAAFLSGATGYLRYRAGKHFYTDVIVGWIVGGLSGILVPQMHKNRNTVVSISPRKIAIGIGL